MKNDYIIGETINIVTACDDAYTQHLCVCIASVMKNSNIGDMYEIFVLYSNIKEENQNRILSFNKISNCKIKLIKLDKKIFKNCPLQKENCFNLVLETYFRFYIPNIFKDKKRVLYLDADIVINKDIKELYSIPFDNNYAVVIEDTGFEYTKVCCLKLGIKRYFNAGVMLLNIPKLIKDNICKKLFLETERLYKQNKLTYQDQCVLNFVLKDKLKFVDIKYNFQASVFYDINKSYCIFGENKMNELIRSPYLIHYSAMKPWKKNSNHPLRNYYYEYLKYTPFKMVYYNKRINNFLKSMFSIQKSEDCKLITILYMKFKCKK